MMTCHGNVTSIVFKCINAFFLPYFQILDNILTPEEINGYLVSDYRNRQHETILNMDTKSCGKPAADRTVYRAVRNFVCLEMDITNGKRAGVLADITFKDFEVSIFPSTSLVHCNWNLDSDILCICSY